MIQLLANRYNKLIASLLLLFFECSFISGYTRSARIGFGENYRYFNGIDSKRNMHKLSQHEKFKQNDLNENKISTSSASNKHLIGGPTQPEMSSFKSIGADNMVNLFTGDFNYNIPLLDVGGYPVNIFYDGSVSPEQESSWVGLGWNINPGTVNRNMRGVPDDFDGTDKLTQTQVMKPNVTWGFTAGYDLELVGIKDFDNLVSGSVGASLDLSFNNYLGPALGLGIKGTTNITIAKIGSSEKSGSVGIGGGISANINSRSGVTISPSLNASAFLGDKSGSFGFTSRLATSYNSRSGIKELQLSEQMAYNYSTMRKIEGTENTYDGNSSGIGLTSSSSISFSKPSYIPSIRMPMVNEAYSGHFQLGNALFGVYGSAEVEAYKQVTRIAEKTQTKPLVGYMYYQKAVNNQNAVMDFTRFNDNEVTPNTPIISAPQYSYDVFSVQGEGTGGTIRAYRNDMGYVRDNTTRSQDKSFSGGGDVGIPGHYGANFNIIKTPTVISEWDRGNKLRNTIGFTSSNGLNESVYFRNPGETSVLNDNQFSRIGGTDLVRFKLGGSDAMPTIEPVLEQFSKTSNGNATGTTDVRTTNFNEREKRSQVISFLTAKEAAQIGLDKTIKSYVPSSLNNDNNLVYDEMPRYYDNDPGASDTWRKSHHISQINITEANGRRYVYGIPVYNVTQKDFTFSVDGMPNADNLVTFNNGDVTENPPMIDSKTKDEYVQVTTTPAYAHSFLLTGLLSPDYVDVTGDGITEDDLGDAVKFNYTRIKSGNNWSDYQWRTPLTTESNTANFNDGIRSETKDDKGMVTYGKRESWYLHSIESKTMIALFTLEDRKDGKGVSGEQSGINSADNSEKRLKKIDLYSKADLKKNGLANAKPIKTVWFVYSYNLCANVPGNNGQSETANGINVNSAKGKLTLDGIYFTYNGKERTNKNKYVFSYTNTDASGNPNYARNVSDRWGTFKPASDNPTLSNLEILKNADYPYSTQNKIDADQNAGAWSLKKILLPSGGQIEVQYESDDYAFVQNRRAATMMRIVGIGKDENSISSNLYRYENGWIDNFYVFVEVPDASVDISKTYLQGFDQLAFRLAVNMPKGLEYINCYAEVESSGKSTARNDNKTIWIKLKSVQNSMSPLTISVLDYLRQRLPGQAFRGYDVSESTGLRQVADILGGMADGLKSAFKDPIMFLRSQGKAQMINTEKSFIRLTDPDGFKYGGGQRVKSVVLKDNWQAMTGQYTSVYGQQYDYTTTEIFNGVERTISSGVASYEPSIGGDENPFFSIVQVADKVPLGPASYGAIEMPVLDAFFPAPTVGYSKVTVRSIQKGNIPAGQKSRSGIGKQVTEFYTAKDFPVYYDQTSLDPSSDKTYHEASLLNFFYKYSIDSRALSQGFLVETNDMHGKLKSQASYAEGDENTRINYTENFYRNTGTSGLNEKFDFVYASKGGEVQQGNMGIDIELMTDTREFSVKSTSFEVQGQVDLFPIIAGLPWIAFIWPVSGNSENTYRAVTTTKVVNYHGILDHVVVIDKGSMVTTKNLVYDAETGDVVVNSTQNEFDKPVYSVNYPAYWAYSGMGLAYKNIDAIYSGVNFLDGKISSGVTADQIKSSFESGDELYIIDPGSSAGCDPIMVSPATNGIIWALDKNKNSSSLSDINPDFIFIDNKGKPYSRSGVTFRIVRSGKRNLLQAPVASIGLMTDPVDPTTHKLVYSDASKVVNSSAVEYKEKWQEDNDVFYRYRLDYPSTGGNLIVNGDFSQGNTAFTTEYTYHPASYSTASPYYSVATSSSGWFSSAANCGQDHTSGSGNMMLVDGATDRERIVWSETVNVVPNTSYLLSAFAEDINSNTSSSPTQLRFKINGVQVGDIFGLGSVYPCTWFKFFNSWNSGNSTSAVIQISSTNLGQSAQDGNDFALDDISFEAEQCALAQIEVPDCSGYLEKAINPYRKGLLGNFRPSMNKVFYGSRNQTNPTIATNLPQDGFLTGFSPYWNFNTDYNLVQDVNNTKWVWNTQSTRFNSKGMELETKDALGIYTAAQYGYQKTLPIAITNNSRYEEMMADGFEDYGYAEALSGAIFNSCAKKHIDFSSATNLQITNTDNLGFAAHSGKYVLGLSPGTATLSIPVTTSADDAYSLDYQSHTLSQLNEPGGNFLTNSESGTTFYTTNSFSNLGAHLETQYQINGGSQASYLYKTQQYFQIIVPGTYSFYTTSSRVSDFSNQGEGNLSWTITSVETGEQIPYTIVNNNSGATTLHTEAQVCIPKGIYLLECSYSGFLYNSCSTCNTSNTNTTTDTYDIFIENNVNGVTSYKSLSTSNTCTYTLPAPATDLMINPTFSIPSAKKMLFSAWVRESNTQQATYLNNQVQIDFGSGNPNNVTINPSGPVIEGWQRYEGYFTAPAGATQMTLKLVNNTGSNIYFDDIRIHPFNANTKTYVYDPVNLRLMAELDANNYATFYEYDEEGTLIRTKVETKQGIKTITETRSFKQAAIKQLQ